MRHPHRHILSHILAHVRGVVRALLLPLAPLYFVFSDLNARKIIAQKGEIIEDVTLRPSGSNRFAVLVLYQRHDIPTHILTLLAALQSAGVDTIAISNLPLAPQARDALCPLVHRLIVRRNFGRDFGAYKIGVNVVLKDYPQAERLLLLNDSVFYRARGLDAFLAALLDPTHPFTGATENYNFSYHVGSFCLAFGPEVLSHPLFRRYWSRFKLSNNRKIVIGKGEIGLSQLIMRQIGIRPHVLYTADRLHDVIRHLPLSEVLAIKEAWPQPPDPTTPSDGRRPTGNQAMRWIKRGTEPSQALSEYHGCSRRELIDDLAQRNKQALMHDIVLGILAGSQIHHAGTAFIKYFNAPITKNDLVFRNIFNPAQLRTLFAPHFTNEEFSEFYRLQLKQGSPNMHWHGIRRLLFRLFFDYF